MSGSPAEVKLVSNAMANVTRRKIMEMLAEKDRTVEEIGSAVGPNMLDYHMKILEQAGLVRLGEGEAALTDFGTNFMQGKTEKAEARTDLVGVKPLELVEVRQLLPCIADKSKFRIIARMEPPLGGALKVLEPLFPRGRYSDKIGSLIIQRGTMLITLYETGNVTLTMVDGEDHAREVLEVLRSTINDAIAKGVTPVPREKVRVDPIEVNRYLPGTNCRECGEQSCYTFAIRLVAGEVDLDACSPLEETVYETNREHLRVLTAYL